MRKLIICLVVVLLCFPLWSLCLAQQGQFVGSKNSDVYHYLSCRYVQNINAENKIYFIDAQDAVNHDYRPCNVCKPPLPAAIISPSPTAIAPSLTATPKPSPTPVPTMTINPTATPTMTTNPTVTPTISPTPNQTPDPTAKTNADPTQTTSQQPFPSPTPVVPEFQFFSLIVIFGLLLLVAFKIKSKKEHSNISKI